jgi:hypothetical protein
MPFLHGGHQVAQMSSSTTLPFKSSTLRPTSLTIEGADGSELEEHPAAGKITAAINSPIKTPGFDIIVLLFARNIAFLVTLK